MKLTPQRRTGESIHSYKCRRAQESIAVQRYLDRPKTAHVSSEIYILPLPGVDPAVDQLILRGELLDVTPATMKDGTEKRLARGKGVTYLHRTKIDHVGMKRPARRSAMGNKIREWRTAP